MIFKGIKHSLGRLAGASTTKMGDIIIFTTVAGWMASSAAQVYGIATNKNYTHEQKKYMINQEVWDAITNIGLYFGITKSLTWITSQMVKSAKLAPKSIVDFMRRTGIAQNRGVFGFDVTQARGFEQAGLRGTYDAFKCFADATAATIGGVISSNIITPVVRNHIAAHRQNQYKSRNMANMNTVQPSETSVKPQNKLTLNTYPRSSTFETFRARSMSV